MAKKSQTKGKRGENEVVALFKEVMQRVEKKRGVNPQIALSNSLYRNLDQYSGDKSGDIDIPIYCVEVKFAEKLLLPKWWKQAVEQANSVGKEPLLFYRSARNQWQVMLNGVLMQSFAKSGSNFIPVNYRTPVIVSKREFLKCYEVYYDHFLWSVGL